MADNRRAENGPNFAFGAFIAERRTRMGLGQNQLATIMGMPKTTYRNLERGYVDKLEVEKLRKIAKPLNVSFEEMCRRAVGLPEPAEPELTPLQRDVLNIFRQASDILQEGLAKLLCDAAAMLGIKLMDQPMPSDDPVRAALKRRWMDEIDGWRTDEMESTLEQMQANRMPGTQGKRLRVPEIEPSITRGAAV